MSKDTQPPRRSFKPYSIATFAVLALVGAAAVFAGVAPASAASLTHEVQVEVFAFLVPLVVLVAAIVIDVAQIAWRNQVPQELTPSPQQLHWATRRETR